jgi:hypothetical protein
MELFGAKFSVALGAWKLRFVLMLEDADAEAACAPQARPQTPHHFKERTAWRATAR